MAYVNVAEWTPEHVAEWLRGLDDAILPYVHFFLNNNIDGHHLLNLAPDDLDNLHIIKVGHQELILEAIDLLRQLHYNLTSETLQCLALKLGCKARSLYSELKRNGPQDVENGKQERVSISTLSSVSDILIAVKSLISWLDRYPFEGQDQYMLVRKAVLKLSIELASTAQRDQFAEKPHVVIKNSCLNLAGICDRIVQEFTDSLIIQPASLDVATIKKKPDEELGMHIQSTYSGIHIVGGVKFQSPARWCGKIEEGDEIIQVNYQTVVGWQLKKLVYAMREHPTEIHLTLKKRPRHTNILGQVIILRPYRIPSKKSAFGKVHKWSEGNSSLHIHEVYNSQNAEPHSPRDVHEDEDDDDSAFLPDNSTQASHQINLAVGSSVHCRVFPVKPQATVQRRATVSGASPTVLRPPVSIEELVAGTSLGKKKESIARSISHDPSKHSTSSDNSLKFIVEQLDTIKSDESEENINGLIRTKGDSTEPNVDNGRKEVFQNNSTRPFTTICISTAVENAASRNLVDSNPSPVKSPEIILPVQEEEYIILENKSLGHQSDEEVVEENVQISEEKTEVFLQEKEEKLLPEKEDKLSSPVTSTQTQDEKVPKMSDDTESGLVAPFDKSYQVVIVGGVPQKCLSSTKDAGKIAPQSPLMRKKTALTGKFLTRRISCKDLGKGDCQGWLYVRKNYAGFLASGPRWKKRWMILKKHHLYSYCDKEDAKAECLIYMPGFTVSPAPECKPKKFAFKLHHSGTTFYFATESQEDMTKWMNKMGLSAIAYDASSDVTTSGFNRPEVNVGLERFYSESEDSETGSPKSCRHLYSLSSREGSPGTGSASSDHSSVQSFSKDVPAKPLSKYKGDYSVYSENGSQNTGVTRKLPSESTGEIFSGHSDRIQIQGSHIFQNISPSEYHVRSVPASPYPTSSHLRSVEHYEEIQPAHLRIAYVRSLSCADATRSAEEFGIHNLPRKMSYEETQKNGSLLSRCDGRYTRNNRHSGLWSSDSKDFDNFSTGSLGRQRPVAKEITPGFVARMAGSYNNLSQKQQTTSTLTGQERQKYNEVSPSPGYVAKISGSFDQRAKQGSKTAIASVSEPSFSVADKRRAYSSSEPSPQYSQAVRYLRQAKSISESKKSAFMRSSHIVHANRNVLMTSPAGSIHEGNKHNTSSEHFISMLDREYHRLYGKKKPSTVLTKPEKGPRLYESITGHKSTSGNPVQGMQRTVNKDNCNLYSCRRGSWKGSDQDLHNSSKYEYQLRKSSSASSQDKHSVGGGSFHEPVKDFPKRHFVTTPGYSEMPSNAFNVKDLEHTNLQQCHMPQCVQEATEIKQVPSTTNQSFVSSNWIAENIYSNAYASEAPNSLTKEGPHRPSRESEESTYSSISEDNVNHGRKLPEKVQKETGESKHISTFKLFGSPKFIKKLSSPKPEKKHLLKSKKLSKEMRKAEEGTHERKFLGSPRLARALFGSPRGDRKTITMTSASVQTDNVNESKTHKAHDTPEKIVINNSKESLKSSRNEDAGGSVIEQARYELAEDNLKTSSNSSLNSSASGSAVSSVGSSHYYVEARIRPQITISLPLVTESNNDDRPETPRTPLKPTMGVSMLGKRRTPSVSSERGPSDISPPLKPCIVLKNDSCKEENVDADQPSVERNEVMVNINNEGGATAASTEETDELAKILEVLKQADLSVDGVDLRARRCHTMLLHFDSKRCSQLALSLRALQRTLKDKEGELRAINNLLQSEITSEKLEQWTLQNPHHLPPDYS